MLELTTSNSEFQEVHNYSLEKGENPFSAFAKNLWKQHLLLTYPVALTKFEVVITVALDEDKKTVSVLMDIQCEEMAYPYLLPTGKCDHKVEREIALRASKYLNQDS